MSCRPNSCGTPIRGRPVRPLVPGLAAPPRRWTLQQNAGRPTRRAGRPQQRRTAAAWRRRPQTLRARQPHAQRSWMHIRLAVAARRNPGAVAQPMSGPGGGSMSMWLPRCRQRASAAWPTTSSGCSPTRCAPPTCPLPNEVLQSLAVPAPTCWRRCACTCACSSCNECRARCCAGVGQRTAAACGAARRAPCMAACRRGHLAQHLAGAEQAALSGTAAATGCLELLRRCGLGR